MSVFPFTTKWGMVPKTRMITVVASQQDIEDEVRYRCYSPDFRSFPTFVYPSQSFGKHTPLGFLRLFLVTFFCHVKRVARTLYLSLLSWYTQAPFLCYVIFQFNPRFTRMTCASFQSYDMAGH